MHYQEILDWSKQPLPSDAKVEFLALYQVTVQDLIFLRRSSGTPPTTPCWQSWPWQVFRNSQTSQSRGGLRRYLPY